VRKAIAWSLILLTCAVSRGWAGPPEEVRVTVDVFAFTGVGWNATLAADGFVRGAIGSTEETERPFSSRHVLPSTIERIRGLARCVVAIPSPEPPECPIMTPLPPMTTLRVTVGKESRRIQFCDAVDLQRPDNLQPSLALLAEMRGLLPKSGAYDYRSWVVPARNRLPAADSRCPWLAKQ